MHNIIREQPKKQSIEELKQNCKNAINQAEYNFVLIGEYLNELKEEMKKEDANFMEWLEEDTRMSYSTANRYMKVAEGYKTKENTQVRSHVVVLGIKKAYLLLKIEDIEERYRFIKDNEIKYKSYETTNELLKKYLNVSHSDIKDPSDNKDTLDKFKKVVDKEIENCNETINNLEIDQHTIYHDIKCKLIELQELLIKAKNCNEEVPDLIDAENN